MLPILTITDNKPPASEYTYDQLEKELGNAIRSVNSRGLQKVRELTRVALSRGWHEMALERLNHFIDEEDKHDVVKAMIAEGVVPNAKSLIRCIEAGDAYAVDMLDFLLDVVKVVPTIEVLEAAQSSTMSPQWVQMLAAVEEAAPADVLQRFKHIRHITTLPRPIDAETYFELCAKLSKAISSSTRSDFKNVLELTRVVLSRGWNEMATELMNDVIWNDAKHPLIRAMVKEGVVPNENSLLECVTESTLDNDDLLRFFLDEVKVVPTLKVLKAADERHSYGSWRIIERLGAIERAMPADEVQRYRQAEEEERRARSQELLAHEREYAREREAEEELREAQKELLESSKRASQVPYRQEDYDEMVEKHLRHIKS